MTPGESAPPAPWTLRGSGAVALFARPLGALMLIRYASSPVGPYDELLWLRPCFSPRGPFPGVERIVVDVPASVEGGRRNWAIPKQRAEFAWRGEQAEVHWPDGTLYARLRVGRVLGQTLPLRLGWLPRRLRTLAQHDERGWAWTTVTGECRIRFARLQVKDAPGLPAALHGARPLLTLGLPRFRLVFGAADRKGASHTA